MGKKLEREQKSGKKSGGPKEGKWGEIIPNKRPENGLTVTRVCKGLIKKRKGGCGKGKKKGGKACKGNKRKNSKVGTRGNAQHSKKVSKKTFVGKGQKGYKRKTGRGRGRGKGTNTGHKAVEKKKGTLLLG